MTTACWPRRDGSPLPSCRCWRRPFVILYLFPGSTMRLWGWMVCPHMSAYVIGGAYLSGAYFFTRAARSRAWHEVGAGFVATTVFSTVLLAVTVLHWDTFNHDHVSFWAWLLLYTVTPALLGRIKGAFSFTATSVVATNDTPTTSAIVTTGDACGHG